MSTNLFKTHKLGMRRLLSLPVLIGVLVGLLFGTPGLALADFSYTVKAGDNLSKIAKNNNTTIDALVAANKAQFPCLATNPACLQIGWVITIPGGGGTTSVASGPSTYTVVSGDSLAKIAKNLGVDFNALIAANKDERPCLVAAKPCALQIGWVLHIPGGTQMSDDPASAIAEFVAAINAKDIARLKAVFVSGGVQNSSDADIQHLFDLDRTFQIHYDLVSTQVIQRSGNTAIVAYTIQASSPLFPPSPNDTVSGQVLVVKTNGQWKILDARLDDLGTVK